MAPTSRLEWRDPVRRDYPDVWTAEAVAACEALAPLNRERLARMAERIDRRRRRAQERRRIDFLDPGSEIPGTGIRVQDARDGKFTGPAIPPDLARQWIQGTGPATRPGVSGRGGRARRAPCATSPTPCSPAPTAGCSTARTPSGRSSRWRSTTSAT